MADYEITDWDREHLGEYAEVVHEIIDEYDYPDLVADRKRQQLAEERYRSEDEDAGIEDDPHGDHNRMTKSGIRMMLEHIGPDRNREVYEFIREHESDGNYGVHEKDGIAEIEVVRGMDMPDDAVDEALRDLSIQFLDRRKEYIKELELYWEDRYPERMEQRKREVRDPRMVPKEPVYSTVDIDDEFYGPDTALAKDILEGRFDIDRLPGVRDDGR